MNITNILQSVNGHNVHGTKPRSPPPKMASTILLAKKKRSADGEDENKKRHCTRDERFGRATTGLNPEATHSIPIGTTTQWVMGIDDLLRKKLGWKLKKNEAKEKGPGGEVGETGYVWKWSNGSKSFDADYGIGVFDKDDRDGLALDVEELKRLKFGVLMKSGMVLIDYSHYLEKMISKWRLEGAKVQIDVDGKQSCGVTLNSKSKKRIKIQLNSNGAIWNAPPSHVSLCMHDSCKPLVPIDNKENQRIAMEMYNKVGTRVEWTSNRKIKYGVVVASAKKQRTRIRVLADDGSTRNVRATMIRASTKPPPESLFEKGSMPFPEAKEEKEEKQENVQYVDATPSIGRHVIIKVTYAAEWASGLDQLLRCTLKWRWEEDEMSKDSDFINWEWYKGSKGFGIQYDWKHIDEDEIERDVEELNKLGFKASLHIDEEARRSNIRNWTVTIYY